MAKATFLLVLQLLDLFYNSIPFIDNIKTDRQEVG